ncbi:MAG: hypothetical protein JWL61_3780 [Gemmatimonadetes bacterium]|nr:hypothetical protein [Gemmatimonadota bacterium]
MTATLLLGTFSILLAYLAQYKNFRWALKGAFLLIFLFLALRYDFGNDYMAYAGAYDGTNNLAVLWEPGWVYLSDVFRPLGFFAMIAALALLNSVVFYRFIERNVPPNLYWMAVCIYVWNPDFMLIHSSAMRQSVAITLFIFSVEYLYRRNFVRYMLCVTLASLFHFSALVLIPAYFVIRPDRRLTRVSASVLFALYIGLFVFGSTLSGYLTQFLGVFFTHYALYEDVGVVRSGLGFLLLTGLFIVTMYYAREQRGELSVIFQIAIISFLLAPLTLILEIMGRIGMNFAPATLVTYPVIVTCLKRSISKAVYVTILLAFVAFKFINFFGTASWLEYFGTYHSIFSTQWR